MSKKKNIKNIKFDEELFVRIFIILVITLLYILSIYSFISFIFWPNEILSFIDYAIEIFAYAFLATLLLIKKEVIIKKII